MTQTATDSPKQLFDDLPVGIFFTGMLVVFMAVALVLSLLYQQTTFSVFLIILLLLALSLRIWGRFSPRKLHYSATLDKTRIFPEESTHLNITVENRKALPVIIRLRLGISGLISGLEGDTVITDNCPLFWYQKTLFKETLTPMKRGFYRTGAPRLITGDLFGFFPRYKEVDQTVDLIVFPKRVPLKPVPVLKRIMFGKSAAASPVQDPIYILGTTDYEAHSPARLIHWKASARHSKLQQKIFEPTEQEKLLLILEVDDFYKENAETAFEESIEAVASLATTLISQHYAIGFLTNCLVHGNMPEYLRVKAGTGQVTTLLEHLARLDLHLQLDIIDLLNTGLYFPGGISCICFSFRQAKGISILHQKRIPVVNVTAMETDSQSDRVFDGLSGVRFCALQDIRLGD